MTAGRVRWGIAALLFSATVINYIDRQALSIVSPVLTKELHITPVEYANILQGFLVAYTIMYAGSGVLVDRWGTRLAFAVFITWWSAANMLHALARSTWQFGAFRFLLGAGESGNFMAAIKATSEWYPPEQRAFVNGLVNAGAAVGAIIAAPLVVALTMYTGWRGAFVITGLFGFVWLAVWLYAIPQGTRPPFADPVADGLRAPRTPWRSLLAHRQTWGLLLARFISDPVWWFYLFWLPKYLTEQRHFTMVEIGMLAWLPYLAADVGSVLGGLGSGALVKRGVAPLQARWLAMVPAALLMPLSIGVAYAPSNTVAMVLICVVTFSHMAWKTNLMTMTNDVYPAPVIGSVAGIVAFGSGAGATLFTNLTGWLVEGFSYSAVFVVMGFLHPISLLLVKWLVREPIIPDTVPAVADRRQVTGSRA